MIGEVDIYGVLFPPLLVWLAVALGICAVLRLGLERMGFYRFVWHRPLFDFSVLLIVVGVVSVLANGVFK